MAVNQLLSVLPHPDQSDRSDISRLDFTFTGDASSISPSDLTLENLTTGADIDQADMSLTYDPATMVAEFTFPGLDGLVLPPGQYHALLDAPGGGGLPFTYDFEAAPVPEPTVIGLAGFALAPLLMRRRRI